MQAAVRRPDPPAGHYQPGHQEDEEREEEFHDAEREDDEDSNSLGDEQGSDDEEGEEEDDDDDDDDSLEDYLLAQQEAEPEEAPVLGQFDAARMNLSSDLATYALEIKQAMQQNREVDCPNDFWCVQWAIIEDNMNCAVARALQLQHYREEYGIVDNYNFGAKCLEDLLDLYPGVYLNFSFNKADGNYMLVEDLKEIDIRVCRDPVKSLVHLRGAYFLSQCLCCDFEAIRRGMVLVHECEGYDWKKNIDIKAIRNLWTDFISAYPTQYHKVRNYHTALFFNILMSMMRKMVPYDVHKKFEVGLQADQRLDVYYNVPNKEVAQKRVLANMKEALRRRYQCEASFSFAETQAS